MQHFPFINDGQVTLVRCDLQTGHVLDNNFQLAINDKQEAYSIFASLQKALEYVKEIKEKRGGIEFIIYDKDKNVISFVEGTRTGTGL